MAGGGGDGPTLSQSPAAAQFSTFLPRRAFNDDSNFDITAMIDLVFMMNIFFLVTSLTKSASEVDLPAAQICVPATDTDCVVVTIRAGTDPENPVVSVGAEAADQDIRDAREQEEHVEAAVQRGVVEKKNKVLIKAEKKVQVRHVVRISAAASSVAGVQPLFAVMELDSKES